MHQFAPSHLRITRHSSQASAGELVCAAVSFGEMGGRQAPEWIHLLPGGMIGTRDGRGPYRVPDMAALIAASMAEGPLPIDQDHAIDLAAPHGQPAPARGWIVEMAERADGLWGRVEWTEVGRGLVEGREYRGISPVMLAAEDGTVLRLLRASLVNAPNLKGLTALHRTRTTETDMDLLAKLRQALGLGADADEAAVLAELGRRNTALQAAQADLATARAELQAARTTTGVPAEVTALQTELATVTAQLNALSEQTRREKATAFVDGAIRAGRVGVKPVRDRYITMHMADAAGTEELINALPVLGGAPTASGETAVPPAGAIQLSAAQTAVARMLGIDPRDYLATLEAERAAQEIA